MDPNEVADALASSFSNAWNQHDMVGFGQLFDHDATFVNAGGQLFRGRDDIQQLHAAIHAGPYRNSALTVKVADAHSWSSDVIVAHLQCVLSGDERTPGETRRTLFTIVMKRRDDKWLIAAAHNTVVAVAV